MQGLRRIKERLFNRDTLPHKNRRGVALVMAVACLAIISYLAMEVTYDSNVEYTVNSQALNQLKAYYAARSGLEVSMLRIKIYQSIMNKYGDQMGGMGAFVDQIWQFPFSWPLKLPGAVNEVDKDNTEKLLKETTMDASFSTDIQDEGSRLDLNDLVSTSKTLRETSAKRLLDLFKNRIETDEKFRANHSSFRFEELVNAITDWMSDKRDSLNGGDKKSAYADLNRDTDSFPPNRGFRTVQELRMVAGMTDEFYEMIAPQVTIFGMRGVNPNVASAEVLKSLDPGIDDRVVGEIEKRRSDPAAGPFKTADEFWQFLIDAPASAKMVNEKYEDIPLSFNTLVSFRIRVIGEFGNAKREIVAIVTDLASTATAIKKYIEEDKKKEAGEQQNPEGQPPPVDPAAKKPATANNPLPKGPPRIVYWSER